MRFSEADIKLDERFLMISDILAEPLIDELDGKLVPESMEALRKRGVRDDSIDLAAKAYLERSRTKNELTCYTLYAYADIPIGKRFDVVFDARATQYSEGRLYLKHVILCLGGFLPSTETCRGRKHICIFEVPDGVPDLLQDVAKSTTWKDFHCAFRFGLADADAWNVLIKTYGNL